MDKTFIPTHTLIMQFMPNIAHISVLKCVLKTNAYLLITATTEQESN